MPRFKNPLSHVHVASPCKADWDQMIGSDRIRFCGQCNLNVYNLSGMSRHDAESLITRTEGRLCVRFYRRRDGSILTNDCPAGLQAVRQRLSYLAKTIGAGALAFLAALGIHLTRAEMFPAQTRSEFMGVMVKQRPLPGAVVGELPARFPATTGRATIVNPSHPTRRSKK